MPQEFYILCEERIILGVRHRRIVCAECRGQFWVSVRQVRWHSERTRKLICVQCFGRELEGVGRDVPDTPPSEASYNGGDDD